MYIQVLKPDLNIKGKSIDGQKYNFEKRTKTGPDGSPPRIAGSYTEVAR
ncbi:hypothetical protein PITCH_A1920090 [uncultured Desulfobacterium sp.]|uniref:Uncharacterized protein n=1 Tax=uncultured Desulfobacterium sp. TaxID=201089 RepID=A0A445MWM9_9BACT|nr:hypothetical protein PITCH_A1920090 [uncultured Desulfobacterium sp.]